MNRAKAEGEPQIEHRIEPAPLSCEEVRDLLYLFLNNELEEDESRQVCAHLFDCAECRKAMAEHVKLSCALKRSLPGIELKYFSSNN
jgi:anti-sigma factor RsiW